MLCLSLAAALPGVLRAQGSTIVGRVFVKGSEVAVGYSVIGVKPGGREQFTSSDGQFTMRDVAAGAVAFSVRHIGYAPYDTTFTVAGGDTIRLRIEMSLVAIQLPAIHSLAKACAHPGGSDAQVGAELAVLFQQVKENAERNRLLSRSYPYELTVERKITKPEPALEVRFIAFDTIVRASDRDWRYAPGKMIGTREYAPGIFGGKWLTVTMPELADFADERFLVNHCFDYGGTDVVDSDTLLRIDFTPAPIVHDPDVAGTIYLDPKTYQLRITLLTLVNMNKALREQTAGQAIRADFMEVIPGVPVLNAVSSVVFPIQKPKEPPREASTEFHRTLSVRFLKGKP